MFRSSVHNVGGEWFCGWLVLFVCQNSWMVAARKWSSNFLCRNFCIFSDTVETLCTNSKYVPKTFKWCHINHFRFQIRGEIFWEAVEKSIPSWGPRCSADWQTVTDKNRGSSFFPRETSPHFCHWERSCSKRQRNCSKFWSSQKSWGHQKFSFSIQLLNKLWVF